MKNNQKGFFLTIEGPDGSGKSTICKRIIEYLNTKNIKNILTKEPGCENIKICQEIRKLLLNNEDLDARTEALLFAANRAAHIQELILPELKANKIVVCDRYIDSSIAYQGFGRNLGFKNIYKINQFATNKLMPDLTIFIDIDPQIGLDRIYKSRTNEINRLDKESIDFHNKIYFGYKKIAKKFKKRFITVNGNQPIDDIFLEIINILKIYLKKKGYDTNEI